VEADPNGNAGSGIILHLLGSGDGVDLRTGEVRIAREKAPLEPKGETFDETGLDLFERWALLGFLHEASLSSDSAFEFSQDGHAFTFLKGPEFAAWAGEGEGVDGVPAGFSAGPFELSVVADPGE
jgi:hypothetical protein